MHVFSVWYFVFCALRSISILRTKHQIQNLMKILVTGSAGFIGSALSLRLLERGDEVIGIDNHNDYHEECRKPDGRVEGTSTIAYP